MRPEMNAPYTQMLGDFWLSGARWLRGFDSREGACVVPLWNYYCRVFGMRKTQGSVIIIMLITISKGSRDWLPRNRTKWGFREPTSTAEGKLDA